VLHVSRRCRGRFFRGLRGLDIELRLVCRVGGVEEGLGCHYLHMPRFNWK